jgi:hypothetical protein
MNDSTRTTESGGTKYHAPEAVRLSETQMGRGCTSPGPSDSSCYDGDYHSKECGNGSCTQSYPCTCRGCGHSANATCRSHGNTTHSPCGCDRYGNGDDDHHH